MKKSEDIVGFKRSAKAWLELLMLVLLLCLVAQGAAEFVFEVNFSDSLNQLIVISFIAQYLSVFVCLVLYEISDYLKLDGEGLLSYKERVRHLHAQLRIPPVIPTAVLLAVSIRVWDLCGGILNWFYVPVSMILLVVFGSSICQRLLIEVTMFRIKKEESG